MINIIKAQMGQARKDLIIIITIIFAFAAHFFGMAVQYSGSYGDLTGSFMAAVVASYIEMILTGVLLIVTARICGADFSDKTINYELVSGHSRKEVYFGRVIVALIYDLSIVIILIVVPIVIATAINGWGHYAEIGEVIIRYLVGFLPLIRFIFFVAAFTFILRDCFKPMLLGYVLVEFVLIIGSLLEEFLNLKINHMTGTSDFSKVVNMANYVYKMIDGKEIIILNSFIDAKTIIEYSLVSVVAGGIYLAVGYFIFKKKDQ